MNMQQEFNINNELVYTMISEKELDNYLIDKVSIKQLIYIPEIYNFSKPQHLILEDISIGIYCFKQAKMTGGSDFIRLKNNQYYSYKHKSFFYFKTISHDCDFVYKYNKLVILKEIIPSLKIDGPCVSLIGTKSSWSHFIVQYLPKLEIIKSYINNDTKVTVVVSEKLDENCMDLIRFIIPKNWIITPIGDEISFYSENLYYIDQTSWITDHAEYTTLGDVIIYDIAVKILQNIISKLYDKYSIKKGNANRKLYLRREGYRTIINNNELDNLCNTLNYEIIYPHMYSIKEKLEIFSEAKIIIGASSSAFSNIIFCNNNVTIINLISKQRIWDTYFATIANVFKLDMFSLVTKDNDYNENPHASFNVDINEIEKILRSYENA